MSGEEDVTGFSSALAHSTTNSVEEAIVSTVQQLSSALLDTSCNIQSLDSKLHKYHQEQSAAVEKLKKDISACKEHINSSSCRSKNVITLDENGSCAPWHTTPTHPCCDSPTSPWKMLRNKEQTIVELERKYQALLTKYDAAQERLRGKCGELSQQLWDATRQLAEEKRRLVAVEDDLRSWKRRSDDQKEEIGRLEKIVAQSEEDLKKQLEKAEGRVEALERELASERSRNSNLQEKYAREKRKSSELSQEMFHLEVDKQRAQAVENSKLKEEKEVLENKCKAKEERISEISSKYDALKRECSDLKKKLEQKERAEDVSQTTGSGEYERLQLEKRDIEEVCLSFDRKLQEQMLTQKKLEERLGNCREKARQLAESKQKTQKAFEDLSQYVNEKVDLLVGLLSMRSSDTFQALFASDFAEKVPPSIQVAEMKSKLHWVLQEVRALCMLEIEVKAQSSRSAGCLLNKTRKTDRKKTAPL